MAIVGVVVRFDPGTGVAVSEALDRLPGVESFALEEPPHTLGALIDARDLDAAHDVLEAQVSAVEGVRAAWPVHAEFGPDGVAESEPRSVLSRARSSDRSSD